MIGWVETNWPLAAAVLAAGSLSAVAWRAWVWPLIRLLGRGCRGAWRAWRKGRRWGRAAAEIVDAQLRPNGGESLIDKIDGLVETDAERIRWQARHDEHHEQLMRSLAAIELRLGVGPAERTVAEEREAS